MTSKWRIVARAAIQKAIAALPTDSSREELKKAIDRAYPFTIRDYHPYKIWLDERKSYFMELGIIDRPKSNPRNFRKRPKKPIVVSPGQLNLFD